MTRARVAAVAGRLALFGLAVGAFVWALEPSARDAIAGWSALLLAAAIACAPKTLMPAPAIGSKIERPWLLLAVAAIASCVSLRGWLTSGTPAFAHDWKWPLVASQLDAWPSMLQSAWLAWGAGAPAVQELASYPTVLAARVLGFVLTPAASLDCVLVIFAIAGGTGAARVAAAAGLDFAWQVLFAAAYPLLPPAFDRLCAGHFNWLLGYALFPHFVASVLAMPASSRRAGSLGAAWGVAASQVQFMAFFALALAAGGKRARSWDAIGAALVALCIQAPMVGAFLAAHPNEAFGSAHANLAWQYAQSSSVLMGLAGGADPVHYFEQVEPLAAFFLAPLVLAGAYGALVTARYRGFAILWLVAAAWAAGLRGPFSHIAEPLFANFTATAILREFSHVEVLVAVPLLLFAALGVRALIPARPAVAAFVFALLVAPGVAPMLEGLLSSIDSPVRVPESYDALTAYVAALPGEGQILWLPEIQPLSFEGTRGGADSLALPIGRHAPYVEYRPTVELVSALRAIGAGEKSSCGLLGDLGIQAVVVRSATTSDVTWPNFSQTPSPAALRADGLNPGFQSSDAWVYGVPCYRGLVTWGPAATLRGDWHSLNRLAATGATDEATLPPPRPAGVGPVRAPRPSYASIDPNDGWIPLSAVDEYLPSFGFAFGDVVLTRNRNADDLAPVVLAAAPASPYRWESADWVRRRLRAGPVAVWNTAGEPDDAGTANAKAGVSHSFDASLGAGPSYAGPPPPAGTLVVLHQRDYGGWSATADGRTLRSLPADGFAVGWLVDAPARAMTVRYAAAPMWLLWAIAFASLTISLALACRPGPKRR